MIKLYKQFNKKFHDKSVSGKYIEQAIHNFNKKFHDKSVSGKYIEEEIIKKERRKRRKQWKKINKKGDNIIKIRAKIKESYEFNF